MLVGMLVLLVPAAAASAQDDGGNAQDDGGSAQDGGGNDVATDVVVEAPRQVTGNPQSTRLFSVPTLAVHPDDPSTVVMAVGDSRNGGCGLWASRDEGRSWTNTAENLLPERFDHCYQRPLFPVMDPNFAPDGTLHVAMPGSSVDQGHPNGPISMLAARTDDLGRSHDTAIVAEAETITADPGDYGQEGEPQEALTWYKAPSLVVDPQNPDRLYLGMRWNVWGTDLQSFEGDVPFRPYVAVSEDGGQTWGEPIDMVENSEGEDVFGALHHELVATPDGTLYSFTREWPPPDSDAERRILMLTSTDGAQTWKVTPILEDVKNYRAPVAAADPDTGDLYLVYAAQEGESEEGEPPAPYDIFATTSSDGGETWSDPVEITDGEEPADSLAVNISVAPNGRIDVAWHDFRNDPFGPGQIDSFFRGERYWDVYHAFSTDGGESWSANTRVTQTFVDAKAGATYNNKDVRGPTGLASTDDAAYVAWPDTRATTGPEDDAEDAYFSVIRFPQGEDGDAQLTSAQGTGSLPWLWAVLGAGAALALAGLLLLVGVRSSRRRAAPAR